MKKSKGSGFFNILGIFGSIILSIVFVVSAFLLPVYCSITGIMQPKTITTVVQNIDYVEIDWIEEGGNLKCTDAHHGDLFKANPEKLYINWAAAMQVQFHVSDLDQSWKGTREEWARHYLKVFVTSAEARCQKMRDMYITPFLKYIKDYDLGIEEKGLFD